MAYRNMNKIICGKFNVVICPKLFSSNLDVCSCLRHYYHYNSKISEAHAIELSELRKLKSCLICKTKLSSKSYNNFNSTTFSIIGGNSLENKYCRRHFSTDRRNDEGFINVKPNLSVRRQSEGDVAMKNQSSEKFALRPNTKSEINFLTSPRFANDKFVGSVKLKFSPHMLALRDTKYTPKGLKHQFVAPSKMSLIVNFKDELLSMENNEKVKKRLGVLNTRMSYSNFVGMKNSTQENVGNRFKNENMQIPTIPVNSQYFSSNTREFDKKQSEVSPKKSQTSQNIIQQSEDAPVSRENSKKTNRAAKYTFQHLAFKTNKENSTFRKIPSRNFFSKSKAAKSTPRLKRDLMSLDINEMEQRHFNKKSSYSTNTDVDFHKFIFTSLDNIKSERESKLTAIN